MTGDAHPATADARNVTGDAGPAQVRVAAVGDVHLGAGLGGYLRPHLERLPEAADVLLLAGDLTQYGTQAEARVVAEEFAGLALPVIAVLGNHDYQSDQDAQVAGILADSGITVLDGSNTIVSLPGPRRDVMAGQDVRLGVAGVKGFGTGFPGRSAAEFGEPQMKAFVRYAKDQAAALGQALADLDADVRIALMHYAPVPDTLIGEPPEIYPFLGSHFLAEAADAAGADLIVHGHAHAGTERGRTPAGIEVRNVALPVLQRPGTTGPRATDPPAIYPYAIYAITAGGEVTDCA